VKEFFISISIVFLFGTNFRAFWVEKLVYGGFKGVF
jgi:hypothetical protein